MAQKAMTRSEIFKTANAMAKATKNAFGDYKIAMSEALKTIYSFLAEGRTVTGRADVPPTASRAERMRRVTVLVKFEGCFVDQYIKENSRLLRKFDDLNSWLEEFNTGRVGQWFSNPRDFGKAFLAYEYFDGKVEGQIAKDEVVEPKKNRTRTNIDCLIGKKVDFDFDGKEITLTVTDVSVWHQGTMVRNYIEFGVSDRTVAPLSKLYEVVEGMTRDFVIEINGRKFACEFGQCKTSANRSSVREAIKTLLSII